MPKRIELTLEVNLTNMVTFINLAKSSCSSFYVSNGGNGAVGDMLKPNSQPANKATKPWSIATRALPEFFFFRGSTPVGKVRLAANNVIPNNVETQCSDDELSAALSPSAWTLTTAAELVTGFTGLKDPCVTAKPVYHPVSRKCVGTIFTLTGWIADDIAVSPREYAPDAIGSGSAEASKDTGVGYTLYGGVSATGSVRGESVQRVLITSVSAKAGGYTDFLAGVSSMKSAMEVLKA